MSLNSKTVRVLNTFGEELDTLIEECGSHNKTVIFVHGFGTDKHETQGLFDDLAAALVQDFRIVRFDFSGYGKSGGRQEDVSYKKMAGDLRSIITYIGKNYRGNIYILAMSMGCFVTCLLSPDIIQKTVLVSIPNADMDFIIERLQQKIVTRPGGVVAEGGISFYPRTSGAVQKLGPDFWSNARSFNPGNALHAYSQKTDLLIIHPLQDEIVGNEYLEVYSGLSRGIYVEVPGNHSFTDASEREKMIGIVQDFLTRV